MRNAILAAFFLAVGCTGTVVAPGKGADQVFLFPYRVDSMPECDGGPGLYIWAYQDTNHSGQLDPQDRRYAQTFLCDGQDGAAAVIPDAGTPETEQCHGSRGKGNDCGQGND